MASGFSGRARPVVLEGREGTASGPAVASFAVPRCVARAFGKAPRGFASQEAFVAFLDELVAQTAFERLESALRMREHSASEAARKLAMDGFTPSQAQTAVDRAVRCGLVDDRRYAEAFVAAKLRAGWGRSRIERGLAHAGVDPRSVDAFPEGALDRDAERDRAQALLERKGVPAKNPVAKLARHLVGKGYEPDMAFSLAREHVARVQAEAGTEGARGRCPDGPSGKAMG